MNISVEDEKVASFVANLVGDVIDPDTGLPFAVEPHTKMKLVEGIHRIWNRTIGQGLDKLSGYDSITALNRRNGSGLMEARSAENISPKEQKLRNDAFARETEEFVKKMFPSRYESTTTDPQTGQTTTTPTNASMLDLSRVVRYLKNDRSNQTYRSAGQIRNQRSQVITVGQDEISRTGANRVKRLSKEGGTLSASDASGYTFKSYYGSRMNDEQGRTVSTVQYVRDMLQETIQNETDEATRIKNEEDSLLQTYGGYQQTDIDRFTQAERKKKLAEARQTQGYAIRANTDPDILKLQPAAKIKESRAKTEASTLAFQEEFDRTRMIVEVAEMQNLAQSGMSPADIQKHMASPDVQEYIRHKAEEQSYGSNLSAASQMLASSPVQQQRKTDVQGALKAEEHAKNAYWITRKREAQLTAQATDEEAKENFYIKQYQVYKANGTPLSPAARRFFEGRSDLDGGEMYLAKNRRSLERGWLVHNSNVATARNILANKSKYGRNSAEVRWANNIMHREKNLRRGGGLIGRVFGGLPPWLIPVLAGVQLIGKLAGFINDTLNKIYKIVDGTTAKAREQQQAQDALGISQSRVKWADSMKNAFGYNFAGAYTATARGLSDIESHEAGTEGAVKAMALMGSSAGIDTTIEQALTGKDTVKATHAALAAFITGTANGDTYLGKQNSAQAYLTNYSQLEKGFGADTAVLAGQLYTQYKAMSKEQKAAANAYLQRGDLSGFVDAVVNSTGGAGIVGMANASSDLQSGLSEMSKMLKDQSQQYKDSFDEIRNQTASTWGYTASAWQNFTNQLKLFAAHTFNGTYGSVTEASSDAQKYAKNKENRLAAVQLISEQEALIQKFENEGVLGTTLANDKERSKFIKLSQGDAGDREKAWGYLYSMANRNNLNDQEVNELISYMYVQNVKTTASEAIKEIDKQNAKDKGIGLVVNADAATIRANAERHVEQAGMDAGNYTFWEKFQDTLTGAGWAGLAGLTAAVLLAPVTGGLSIPAALAITGSSMVAGGNAALQTGNTRAQNAYAVQRKVMGTEGEEASDKQWHRDLSVAERTSGAVYTLENVQALLDKVEAAGYTASVQEVKVDVQAGRMYIQFDDPVSGRNRIEETPLTGVYSTHTNYGASTGNYNEAVDQMNVLNQAKVQ